MAWIRGARIFYCHGLESGPNGYKVRELRARGLDVIAPPMEMSLWDIRQRNSIPRSLMSPSALLSRWPTQWFAGAMDDSFTACVQRCKQALDSEGRCTVLLGSSWGGAVGAALIADGQWNGPAVLLCPALKLKDRWAGSLDPALNTEAITARLAALPSERKASLLIVQGTADDTVPVEDSQSLSEATGIALELIEGGSHGLGSIVTNGRLVDLMQRVAGADS